jgi:hypothetical protein
LKQCLSPNDLLELSERQKSALRDLWLPNRYDLALEIVWKDVENDICEGFLIMVMDARAIATPARYCEVVLRVIYLTETPQYESLAAEFESAEDEEFNADSVETSTEDMGDTESAVVSADHFLNKENCLPLLNIGQMIEILSQHKGEPNISFAPEEAICYIGGEEFSGGELCDVLWEAVKTVL